MEKAKRGPYALFIKRLLDIMLSMLFIIGFCWLYAIIAILVKVKLGSPVLFKQERPGKIDPKTGKEKIFAMYKFRSMTNEKDADGNLLPDEQRMNDFSRWIRRTSCDELPELFNIVKGDMSIIGPRPLLVRYLDRYNEEQQHRHDVRPGLTGYAQAHGRNALSWEEKFKMDVWYIQHVTFKTDIGIFFATIKIVLEREGISSDTSATMEEFMGNEVSK